MSKKTKQRSELISSAILEELDKLPMDERVEAIDDAIHRLNFERRFTLLTDDQLKHMKCVLSDEARNKLDEVKDTPAFDEKIEEYARSHYFRKCAWITYLNEGGEPPIPS